MGMKISHDICRNRQGLMASTISGSISPFCIVLEWEANFLQVLWIFLMGIAGAASRYALGLFLKPMMPWPTLAINFLGCILLELIYQCMPEHTQGTQKLKTALGVGFIGAFTTFSTFCNEALGFLQSGHFLLAFTYAASGMLSGLLGIALGMAIGQRLTKGRVRIDG